MEKDNIVVSIIIPVYNVESTVSRCLDSVILQTYRNLEIVVVNDGSTDTSPNICDSYAKKDPRITVLHKQNGGLSSARNYGIEHCHGAYIAFVDSDDYLEPDYVSALLNLILNNNADLSICSYYDEHDNNGGQMKDLVTTGLDYLQESLKRREPRPIVAWDKLYNRSLCENNMFPIGKIHEDEFIYHEVLFGARKVALTSKKLYHYTKNEKSIISSPFSIKNLDRIEAYIQRLDFVIANNINDVYDSVFRDIIRDFGYALRRYRKTSDAAIRDRILKLINELKVISKPIRHYLSVPCKIMSILSEYPAIFSASLMIRYRIRNLYEQ
ncbi:glycosyltransferase family 2 protein [Bifidobacterium olomucense]|uniref:Glycosyltransferase family 2 n=1 Tax=Bifidobacterium olomucense TaxID=2675324 RepID=A0A7Y0EZJ0_9BIFI|nr:glycosyltransferase [Bifidobacterium sp. DSM 109959]NMM99267.1 glycosyltransferase family 2 [Bifidobacterium sp. DSM 109959]